MMHRIRFAMNEHDETPLNGTVEVDELFVGGAPRHFHKSRKTEPRRKSVVVGLLERGGWVRPKVVADIKPFLAMGHKDGTEEA